MNKRLVYLIITLLIIVGIPIGLVVGCLGCTTAAVVTAAAADTTYVNKTDVNKTGVNTTGVNTTQDYSDYTELERSLHELDSISAEFDKL